MRHSLALTKLAVNWIRQFRRRNVISISLLETHTMRVPLLHFLTNLSTQNIMLLGVECVTNGFAVRAKGEDSHLGEAKIAKNWFHSVYNTCIHNIFNRIEIKLYMTIAISGMKRIYLELFTKITAIRTNKIVTMAMSLLSIISPSRNSECNRMI